MLDQAVLAALNHLLLGASWAQARLKPYAGKAARLTLPPFQVDFRVSGEGLLDSADSGDADHDVEISLPADAPLLLMRGTDTLAKAIHVSGSAEFADSLGFVLRNLTWDFEEDLSRQVGDIAAHRIAEMMRAIGGWHRQATRSMAENVAEYLVEEQPTLLARRELSGFSNSVAQLGDDLDQVESRMQRLRI